MSRSLFPDGVQKEHFLCKDRLGCMVRPDGPILPKTFVLICEVKLQLLPATDLAKFAIVSASGYNTNRKATEPNTKSFIVAFLKKALTSSKQNPKFCD